MIDPVAFTVFGFQVKWYGIFISLAVLLGYLLACREEKRLGLPQETMLDLFFWIVPPAIVCARIYYVALKWDSYRDDLKEIFMLHHGGIAIYGAVLGGLAGLLLFAKKRKLKASALMDMVMPSLVLGQAIGRWGNFVNQEAYGYAITDPNLCFFPFGVYIEALGEWHLAAFFYESVWCFLIFLLLMTAGKRLKKSGDRALWYVFLYGTERAVVEGLRTDSLYLGSLRLSQILSQAALGVVLLLFFLRKSGNAQKRGLPALALGLLACAALLFVTVRYDFAAVGAQCVLAFVCGACCLWEYA